MSLLIPSAYVFDESIYCIILSLLTFHATFLIYSVNILCFSFLNICCDFNINILFFMNHLKFSLRLSGSSLFFSLDILFYFQIEFQYL